MSGFCTLDTGILISLDRGDPTVSATLRRFTDTGWVPVVPSVVVAEAWRDPRQVGLARALRHSSVVTLDDSIARRAGELNGRARLDDPVDAVVVVTAAERGGVLLTSDPDLAVLVDHLPPGGPPLLLRRPV